MAVKTYVAERQVEYWTSRQLEDFLLSAGYDLRVFPLQQHVEQYIPADFIYGSAGRVKLFGIQYKALYSNGSDFWKLDQTQHTTLSQFDWIYYGLSDLRDASQSRNSLYYLRVYETAFQHKNRFSVKNMGYMRWGAFYQKLIGCQRGIEISSKRELRNQLRAYNGVISDQAEREIDNVVDVFAVDIESKRGIRISSLLQNDLDFFGDEGEEA